MRDAPLSADEQQFEATVRPSKLAEYIGQTQVKENLRVYMKAALRRKEALDHVLLTGPPGLGKTTLAHIIANEMGAELRSTAGPASWPGTGRAATRGPGGSSAPPATAGSTGRAWCGC